SSPPLRARGMSRSHRRLISVWHGVWSSAVKCAGERGGPILFESVPAPWFVHSYCLSLAMNLAGGDRRHRLMDHGVQTLHKTSRITPAARQVKRAATTGG